MIDKGRYFAELERLLEEHYSKIKAKGRESEKGRHFIDGYLTAARALGGISYGELQEVIERVHLRVFGKTIKERRRTALNELSPDDDSLVIPTYIRMGIPLDI